MRTTPPPVSHRRRDLDVRIGPGDGKSAVAPASTPPVPGGPAGGRCHGSELPGTGARQAIHYLFRLPPVVLTAMQDDQDRVLLILRYRFIPGTWGWALPSWLGRLHGGGLSAASRRGVEDHLGGSQQFRVLRDQRLINWPVLGIQARRACRSAGDFVDAARPPRG